MGLFWLLLSFFLWLLSPALGSRVIVVTAQESNNLMLSLWLHTARPWPSNPRTSPGTQQKLVYRYCLLALSKKQAPTSTSWCSNPSMLLPFITKWIIYSLNSTSCSASLEGNNYPVTTSNDKINHVLKKLTHSSWWNGFQRGFFLGSPSLSHHSQKAQITDGLNLPLQDSF